MLVGFIFIWVQFNKVMFGHRIKWKARHHRGIPISHNVKSQPGDIRAVCVQCTNYREHSAAGVLLVIPLVY